MRAKSAAAISWNRLEPGAQVGGGGVRRGKRVRDVGQASDAGEGG
jgi:hypothetical protein